MKSTLTTFIFILALSLISLLRVNAIVKAPSEPYFPVEDPGTPTGVGSSPGVIAPYPAPDEPVQIDPASPISFTKPITRNPINKTPPPAPSNLNNYDNYDIFGNNQPRLDFRVINLFCCLCILGLVCLSAIAFVIIHKLKKK